VTGSAHGLDGILVVALEQAVAAPFASRQLADFGARVIKIERPGPGDFARGYDRAVHGQASYFVWLNRGKESIELDLKLPSDRAVVSRMLGRADVFLQNLAPGAAARLGLGAAELRRHNKRLITCSISGYGDTGPYADKKAYDLLVQCEAGLLSVTGTADHPAKVGISVADIAAGMYAYSGILGALYERERTGEGAQLDIAMIDALGEWMMQQYYYTVYRDRPPERTGSRHASIAPYGPYTCTDGQAVYLGVQNDREWAALCRDVLKRNDLTTDPRFAHNVDRVANNEELTVILQGIFSSGSAEAVIEMLDAAGIANARMRTPGELGHHPQLAARHRWRDVNTPAGPIRALVPPVSVAGREVRWGAVPGVGDHNAALRREFRPSGGADGHRVSGR
jgi:itaconate CoA-transferase